MKAGEKFSELNVKSVRPGHGLHPKHFNEIMGKRASKGIKKGTPLTMELL
jgi:sialic acid synthase SpsE